MLKEKTAVKAGEIVDAAVMSRKALASFIARADRRCQGAGRAVLAAPEGDHDEGLRPDACSASWSSEFYKDVLAKHAEALKQAGFDPNNGIGDLYSATARSCRPNSRRRSRPTSQAEYAQRPALAMVNSDKGITNLHVPSDVIIDASMPAMIRDSGQMWNADGKLQDTKAVIPDRCYAGVYQATIEDCKAHGAFDPATMGSVPNVGLMAQAAEEYGSHDKTFQIACRRRRACHRRGRQAWCSSTRWRPATSGACARPRTRRSRTG